MARGTASIEFGKRCQEAGVRPWMGSVRDAYDKRWRRLSSPRSNVSCSSQSRFETQAETAGRSPNSLRASTVRAGDADRLAICFTHHVCANMRPRSRTRSARHAVMLRARQQRPGDVAQVAPPAAGRRDSLSTRRHWQHAAGTKRCSRAEPKDHSKERTECRQTRYPGPKPSPLHGSGASPDSLTGYHHRARAGRSPRRSSFSVAGSAPVPVAGGDEGPAAGGVNTRWRFNGTASGGICP